MSQTAFSYNERSEEASSKEKSWCCVIMIGWQQLEVAGYSTVCEFNFLGISRVFFGANRLTDSWTHGQTD